MSHNFKQGDVLYHTSNPSKLHIFIGDTFTLRSVPTVSAHLFDAVFASDVAYHHKNLRFLCRAEHFHLFRTQWYIDMTKYRDDDELVVCNYLRELGFRIDLSGSAPVIIKNTQLSCAHEGVFSCIRDGDASTTASASELKLNLKQKVVVTGVELEDPEVRKLKNDLKLAKERFDSVVRDIEDAVRDRTAISREIESITMQLEASKFRGKEQ